MRNNFCELVGVVNARKLLSELRKIAINSFGRFVLFGVVFFSRYPSFPVCFGFRTGRGGVPVEEQGTSFGVIIGKNL